MLPGAAVFSRASMCQPGCPPCACAPHSTHTLSPEALGCGLHARHEGPEALCSQDISLFPVGVGCQGPQACFQTYVPRLTLAGRVPLSRNSLLQCVTCVIHVFMVQVCDGAGAAPRMGFPQLPGVEARPGVEEGLVPWEGGQPAPRACGFVCRHMLISLAPVAGGGWGGVGAVVRWRPATLLG